MAGLLRDTKSKCIAFGSITIFTSLAWIGYLWKLKKDRTFYTISDIKHARHLLQQTKDLLHSEWKNQSNRFPDEKQNDDEPLPCHRILSKTEPYSIWNQGTMMETVLAHVSLTESRRALSAQRLRTMLKIKQISDRTIKLAAKRTGIDLNEARFCDAEGNLTLDALTDAECKKEANIGSLVVGPAFRRQGFAKLLLSESVLFVYGQGYGKVVGHADKKLLPFYERLGGNKETQRAHKINAISREFDDVMLRRCRETLRARLRRYRVVRSE